MICNAASRSSLVSKAPNLTAKRFISTESIQNNLPEVALSLVGHRLIPVHFIKLVNVLQLESNLKSVVQVWEQRRLRMRPSSVLHESVLEVRRAVLTLAAYRAQQEGWDSRPLNEEVSSLWLRSAQLARE